MWISIFKPSQKNTTRHIYKKVSFYHINRKVDFSLNFWQFSRVLPHLVHPGKLPKVQKSPPGGLCYRQYDFLPTCHKGLHDHLRSVMSMHLWRFFLHFFEFFCIFWVNWTIERSPVLKKKFKKILVQVAPEPSTVEMVRDLVLWKRAVLLKREVWCRVGGCGLAWILAGVRSHARSFPSGKMRIGVRPKEKLKGLMKGALNISL